MFLPLLVSTEDARYGENHLLEDFTQDLDVGYSFGPPYGGRLVTWDDLDELEISQAELRQVAVDNLYRLLPRLRIDGQPPAPMLSFGGLESTVLLAAEVWEDLERSVPGELVVGVPARDVVIVTGTASRPGIEKVRRAVDRVFFAGDQNLLSRELLVWREGGWSTYRTTPEPEPRADRWEEPGRRRGAAPKPEPEPERWRGAPEPEPEPERWRSAPPEPERWQGTPRVEEPDRSGPRRWRGDARPEPEPAPEPERRRDDPRPASGAGRARWHDSPRPEPEPEAEPEPGRWRGASGSEPGPYRLPRQRSGDGGTTDWPERPPVRGSKRRKPRPSGPTR
ncbi:hypothetical protein [Plantactinospora sp. B6F1]|uniref:hypothetical protein n=1 Tax=Plantactinospora sp. B6F1 TaxID=3158971 RepID=UPI0032D8DF87